MRIAIVDIGTLARNWWVVLVRGLAAIAFGIVTLLAPALSLGFLVILFGAYAFADGTLSIASFFLRREQSEPRWILLLSGLTGIVAGLVTFFWPGITAVALYFLIAAWALVTGVFELVAAIRLRKAIRDEWLLGLAGVASMGLGILLLLLPGAGLLALVLWIGAYAIVYGGLLIALAFRLKSWAKSHEETPISAARGVEPMQRAPQG
jgi:uncharacterized membrane protein HdeD (DUF308 family)